MRRARGCSAALDRQGRVWSPHKVQRIVKEMLVISKPRNGAGNRKKSKNGKAYSDTRPNSFRTKELPRHDTPHRRTEDPAIVSGEDGCKNQHAETDQPAIHCSHPGISDGGYALHRQQGRPDNDRQKQRLRHRRGRQVQKIGIESIEGGRHQSPLRRYHPSRQPIQTSSTQHIRQQRRPCPGKPVLPPLHLLDERKHQQMRQREPHTSKLDQPWISRVENSASDAQVSHRIAIEQKIVAAHANDQRDKRKRYRSDGDRHGLFALGRTHLEAQRRWSVLPFVREDSAYELEYSRCEISLNSLNRSSISSRVTSCRRSVPKRSTAKDPMTPP